MQTKIIEIIDDILLINVYLLCKTVEKPDEKNMVNLEKEKTLAKLTSAYHCLQAKNELSCSCSLVLYNKHPLN